MKREKFKGLALLLVLLMISAMLIGCGGGDTDDGNGDDGNGDSTLSSLEQLLAMEDDLPLSGLQPAHYDDRDDVEKAADVEQKDDVTIGWLSAFQGSPFFLELTGSAMETADKYGYDFQMQDSGMFELNTQLTQFENFITLGVDVIVLNAVDLKSSLATIDMAVDAGIPVIVTGPVSADPSYRIITNVIAGSLNSGYEVGMYTASKMYTAGSDPLKMGFALSMLDSSDAQSRSCGFIAGYLYQAAEIDGNPYDSKWDAVLDGYNAWLTIRDTGSYRASESGMPLDFVGYGTAGSTDASAGQIASADLLTANPDMDILFVETDTMLPGALTEVDQQGFVVGEDLKIVCAADGTTEALEYVISGELFATATNISTYNGVGIVELIHSMFGEGFDANNMPVNEYTPTMCINGDNVDEYYDANAAFALATDWSMLTIEEYNALHADDVAE